MKPGKIRTIAICVIEYEGKILVHVGYDVIKKQHFGRPLGGGIEFGELGRQAIIREFQEELGAEVCDVAYLATFENIFTHNGAKGHEIVLVYRGRLVDETLYQRPQISGQEDDGTPITASWVALADFSAGKLPLYPDGLLELLK
jgi:ADP-ribose pyrophosphatase YjhB (NUDIX family)